jgi:RHS repeat-associated protein
MVKYFFLKGHGGKLIDKELVSTLQDNAISLYGRGEAVAISRSSGNSTRSGTTYLGKDILGSVRTSTNDTGDLEDRYEYDAFGKPYKGDLNNGMNLGYTGKPYDSVTGMYNYGYRDYAPETARFTTVDPIRDGANWFAYVNNDPVNYIDSRGLLANDIKNAWERAKENHFNKNAGNHPPQTIPNYDYRNPPNSFVDEKGKTWTLMDEKDDRFHEQGKSKDGIDPNNNKYVSEDGHEEGVYDENGNLVTDSVNQGTYNKSDPQTNPIGHFVNDIFPYWVWGNSEDDPTSWTDRIGGTYNGPIP